MTRKLPLFLLAFAAAALTACDAGRDASPVAGPQHDLFTWSGALVTTSQPTESKTVVAVIGREGGKIQNGDHSLTIPRRAVSGDTEFTFTMVGGTKIQADLTAKNVATGLPVTTFANNLTLRLSYRNANVSDPSRLAIVWVVAGAIVEKAPSYVDTFNQQVLGSLSHFSDWGLAAD